MFLFLFSLLQAKKSLKNGEKLSNLLVSNLITEKLATPEVKYYGKSRTHCKFANTLHVLLMKCVYAKWMLFWRCVLVCLELVLAPV